MHYSFAGGGHKAAPLTLLAARFFYVSKGGGEKVLHAFGGIDAKDGGSPSGSVIAIGTQLYGTTEFGGLASCNKTSSADQGCGAVYSMTTGGGEVCCTNSKMDSTANFQPKAYLPQCFRYR